MTLQEVAANIKLDMDRTLTLFMGKEEMYVKFLKKYPANAQKLLADLEAAVQAGDHKGIEAGAHGLKGVSANLGVLDVAESSAVLVADIRDAKYEHIAADYQRLLEQTRTAVTYIEQLD